MIINPLRASSHTHTYNFTISRVLIIIIVIIKRLCYTHIAGTASVWRYTPATRLHQYIIQTCITERVRTIKVTRQLVVCLLAVSNTSPRRTGLSSTHADVQCTSHRRYTMRKIEIKKKTKYQIRTINHRIVASIKHVQMRSLNYICMYT